MQLPWRSLPQPPPARIARPIPRLVLTALLVALVSMGWLTQWIVWRVDGGGVDPLLNAGALTAPGLIAGRWWLAGTHLFLHAGPVWLAAVSIAVLALAGRSLERIVGKRHTWQIFALAGTLGGLGQVGFDALLGLNVQVAGVSSASMGLLLALACVSPRTPLLPWGRAGGALRRVKVVHGTLGALAATVAAGTTPPAASALVGGLTGCLYIHALGFYGRWPDDDEDGLAGTDAGEQTSTVSAASSASWPPGESGLPVAEASKATLSTGDVPAVLTAPATAAKALLAPRFTERERRMTAREFIAERVDPVLDKISREGFASLTAEERQVLEKAREKMGQG